MSTSEPDMSSPRTEKQQPSILQEELKHVREIVHDRPWRWLALFMGAMLPLALFAWLGLEVVENEGFAFDRPILEFGRDMASPVWDKIFLFFSEIGYSWGVIPFDILFVLLLAVLKRYRESVFAAITFAGSGLLNTLAKQFFQRPRPTLWESIAPEQTFSFPSGHAMGSMTLAAAVVMLAWRTRWRWPVTLAAFVFVVGVGFSRVYLGVHYPSDIIAGWSAAIAWTVGCYWIVFNHHHRPWHRR